MKQPQHCACCGRKRGDGRRDRGWLYWFVEVRQHVGNGFMVGPISVPVAFCATCWRTEIKPQFEKLYAPRAA